MKIGGKFGSFTGLLISIMEKLKVWAKRLVKLVLPEPGEDLVDLPNYETKI